MLQRWLLRALVLFSFFGLFSCVPVVESLFYDSQILPERFYNKNFLTNYKSTNANHTQLGLLADNHQNYQDLLDVVGHLNERSQIDGIVHMGDFTNLGSPSEYRYFLDIFRKLQKPHYAVMGNHDATGIGYDIYEQTMGPRNHDLVSDPIHFIFLDNNALETGSIDWDWLETTLSKVTNSMKIVFMHINPGSNDYFSAADQARFLNLMTVHRVGLIVHGHNHVYLYGQWNGVHFLQIERTERSSYSALDVQRTAAGEYDVQIYRCRDENCFTSDFFHFSE